MGKKIIFFKSQKHTMPEINSLGTKSEPLNAVLRHLSEWEPVGQKRIKESQGICNTCRKY